MDLSALGSSAFRPFWEGLVLVVLFAAVCAIGRWAHSLLLPFDVEDELTGKDNPALGISVAGYYLGIAIIFTGASLGPSKGLETDALVVFGYALGGVVLLLLSRYLNDGLILRGFSIRRELLEDRNPATGAVLFGSYVASALVIAGAVHGEGGGPLTALVFYALGQAALVLLTWLYDWITPYSLHREIEADNLAAGVGFCGVLIATGIIIMRATAGDFVSWAVNLEALGLNLLLILVYLAGVRLFFDRVLLSQADLNAEIARDRNVGAGLLECAASIGFAAVLFLVL